MKYTFLFTPIGATSVVTVILCPGGKNPALAGLKVSHTGQVDIIEPIRGASVVPVPRGLGVSTENFRACLEFTSPLLAEQYARVGLTQMRGCRGILIKQTQDGGVMRLRNAVCVGASPEVIGILTITDFTFTGSQWTY